MCICLSPEQVYTGTCHTNIKIKYRAMIYNVVSKTYRCYGFTHIITHHNKSFKNKSFKTQHFQSLLTECNTFFTCAVSNLWSSYKKNSTHLPSSTSAPHHARKC